ncbi:hypothetical protein V7S43_009273 [Phytophthora oleae]|uniref:BED-type domain-containing protein n=1 Tax=Phytophthora oleae TaxID=2107226 RepID=A0ABD3FHP2_9STRA
MPKQRAQRRGGTARHAVWEHFEEVEPRTNPKSHPMTQCNHCNERVRGQPKSYMVPHVLKCPNAPQIVKQQFGAPQASRSSTEEASGVGSEERLEIASQTSQLEAIHPQTLLQRLELLKLKTKVAKYQAQAVEAEFKAEKMAIQIKLQELGVSEDEIERNLPSL